MAGSQKFISLSVDLEKKFKNTINLYKNSHSSSKNQDTLYFVDIAIKNFMNDFINNDSFKKDFEYLFVSFPESHFAFKEIYYLDKKYEITTDDIESVLSLESFHRYSKYNRLCNVEVLHKLFNIVVKDSHPLIVDDINYNIKKNMLIPLSEKVSLAIDNLSKLYKTQYNLFYSKSMIISDALSFFINTYKDDGTIKESNIDYFKLRISVLPKDKLKNIITIFNSQDIKGEI